MANIFPIDFEEKLTMAQDDYILFSDSEDWNKIKKAQYKNLKWEKGDKWDTGATWPQGETWPQWPQWIQGIQWPKGDKWDTWARINSAEFSGGDIVFGETDWNTVTLEDAVSTLTWPQWPTWPQGEQWIQGIQWPQGDKGDKWDKWDKGDKGDTWDAATITVWTTTTSAPWGSASVTNSGTTSAAIFDFTIPRWETWPKGDQWLKWETWATWPQGEQGVQGIQWETWPQGETGATWNWIASITSSKSWKITTVTITETDGNVDSFQISDGADWEWAWDVIWPNSSTNNHVALFDWVTWKIIKDWGALPSVINSLDSTSTTDSLSAAQGKALNEKIDNLAWLWKFLSLWNSATWQPISFPLATPYTYSTWDWFMVEVVWTTNYKPNGSSYTWSASTTVESWEVAMKDVYIYDWQDWLLQKNTEVTVSFGALAWQPTDNANLAAALNAKQNTLTTQTAYTSQGSATKVPQISTNSLWQVTWITEVTITQPTKTSDLTNDSGYITSSAIPTDYVKTSWNQTIAWTKTFSTSPVVPSKTTAATNTWTAIATEAQVYKKQDTISDLATIRSWAGKWATSIQPNDNVSSLINDAGYLTSSTWVTTVNWNHWAVTVQATLVSWTNIKTVNSTSLLGSWNIAVQPTLVSWTNIKTINSTSLLGSGNIAINQVPSGWTTGYVLTKNSSWYWWAAPTGWIQLDSASPIQLTKIWAGTEAQYQALWTYDNTTVYLTI